MKKILLSTALLLFFVTNTFAVWVTIEVLGVKTGPTTSDGSTVTFNCDYTLSTCAKVVIDCAYGIPSNGDPTIVNTFSQGKIDAQFSGGYVSMSEQHQQNETTTHYITLTDLQGN